MRLMLLWGSLLLGVAFGLRAEEYGIFIRQANLTTREGETIVSADVEYEFTPTALEALDNGVPLTLLVEISLLRERPYWFAETILEEQRRIQLRYHPLAKSYLVVDQTSGAVQSFASLSAVKDVLSRIRGWRLADAGKLETGQSYEARLSLKLDIESLPLPLRAVAYLSPEWHLSSPVLSWRVEP